MDKTVKLTEREETINLYLQACVHLYGYIAPRRFMVIFNRYNEPKLLKAELMRYAYKLNLQKKNYFIYSNAIVNTDVEAKVIDMTIAEQRGKVYYIPPKDELLKWADEEYCPVTPQGENLKNVLLTKFNVSPSDIDSLMKELFWSVLIAEETEVHEAIVAKYHAFDNKNIDKNIFYAAYDNFANNTRLWINCGYTPLEIMAIYNIKPEDFKK